MTAVTLELPDELAKELDDFPKETVNAFAALSLAEFTRARADGEAARLWWESLSETEKEAEAEKTRRSVADGVAGRVSPAAEVYARLRVRLGTKAV